MKLSTILYIAGTTLMAGAVAARAIEVNKQMRVVEGNIWQEANAKTSDTKESSSLQSSQQDSQS